MLGSQATSSVQWITEPGIVAVGMTPSKALVPLSSV